jgi:hypothetical protein
MDGRTAYSKCKSTEFLCPGRHSHIRNPLLQTSSKHLSLFINTNTNQEIQGFPAKAEDITSMTNAALNAVLVSWICGTTETKLKNSNG